MDKDEFFDILFTGAWISIIVLIFLDFGVMCLEKYLFPGKNFAIAFIVLAGPIVMYLVCRHLYYRKYGK